MNGVFIIFVAVHFHHRSAVGRIRPGSGVIDLHEVGFRRIDGRVVHLYNRVALLRKGLVRHFLHIVARVGIGHDVFVDEEERRLQNGVRSAAEAEFARDGDRVDDVKFGVFLGEGVLDFRGEVLVELLHRRPRRVQKELAAFFQIAHHVVTGDVRGVMAGDEVRRVDEIGRLNGGLAESQMRNGDAAALLGIVEEISLRVHIGVIADDLDGVFVRADRAVRAETVELTADRARGRGVVLFGEVERRVGEIVVNTHGEVVFGFFLFKVLVNRVDHRGVELFGAEAVSAAHHLDVRHALFEQSGAYVEVQRFAQRAGFLRPVEHREFFHGLGQRRDERVHGERAVQPYFQHADLMPFLVHSVDGFFDGFRAAAHDDGNVFRVGRAHVIEEVIFSARQGGDLVHHLLHDGGGGFVILVRRFAVLEVDVRILRRAFLNRMFGVERACAEIFDFLHVDEGFHFVVIDDVDLAHFMAGTEPVEEVQKRHFRFQRGKVRDEREVHNFLYGVAGEHRKARLTARHHVGMVAENIERVRRQSSRADVEDRREQFARDLVHIRNHQK